MQEIGLKIKKIRLNKGLALKELASKSGLTSSFLSQLENGMTAPSVASLHKIAEALGIKVANLFQEGEGAEFVFSFSKSGSILMSRTDAARIS